MLIGTPKLLKHRVLLAMLYGCGLRCAELCNIQLADLCFERKQLHVRKGKGRKDRYVPLPNMLVRGLRRYIRAERPVIWLGRYMHKIAISNHRIKDIDNGKVTFSAKDYRKGGKKNRLPLPDKEFIGRFAMHVLPKGFIRIRHYGILSSYHKKLVLPKLKKELVCRPETVKDIPLLHRICPVCKKGKLVTVATFDKRGPPASLINILKTTF